MSGTGAGPARVRRGGGDLLLTRIGDRGSPRRAVAIPHELVVRASTTRQLVGGSAAAGDPRADEDAQQVADTCADEERRAHREGGFRDFIPPLALVIAA